MKSKQKYLRLTTDEKKLLINRSLNGESISKICLEAGISRTIFYRWMREYSKKSKLRKVLPEQSKKKKHWRKQKTRVEQEIVRLWINNPGLSVRDIAKKAKVSTGGAFNIIKRYKIEAQKKGKEIKRHAKKRYKILTPIYKKELIDRYYKGATIISLCREAGVSRTIFYKWLKKYGKAGNEEILRRKIPRAESHWRFIPGVRERVLDIISDNPQISLSNLAIEIKNEGKSISRSGLYYVLKGMSLTTLENRLAYAHSQSLSAQGYEQLDGGQLALAEATNYLPRFAVFMLFWMIVSLVLFNSISKSVEMTGDLARQISPTVVSVAEKTADGVKKRAAGFFEPVKSDQDLGWGALAMNSPQSSYSEGEDIQLGFGVVDHAGNTVCNADIDILVFSPKGQMIFESGTGDGVQQSGECSLQSVTNTPDYLVNIPPIQREGIYAMGIKARTYEGEKEFSHKLIVQSNNPFDIDRSSYPTRIFPEAKYPVEIKIKANRDFKGDISDFLPEGIIASNISGGGVLFKKDRAQDHKIKWSVDLKKGETYVISYTLHFPQVWPEFYEIGPIELVDRSTGKVIYREARYWQVAADAAN